MHYFLSRLQTEIAAQVTQLLDIQGKPVIQPGNPKVGSDMAIPLFAFSKEKGQGPDVLATKVAGQLSHDAIVRAEAMGGFVNLWFNPEVLIQTFIDDLMTAEDEGRVFGEHAEGKGKVAIVEFPSANMAKPFSVGHLRPSTQGWAVRQLMVAMGYTVVTDDHLGDWGTPFGKWAVGYKEFSSEEQLTKGGVYELGRVYVKTVAELKYEAEHNKHQLADEVQEWLLKLESGDEEAVALSKRFNQISLAHIHDIKKRLKISTDEELGESFYIPEAKRMVTELLEKGIATQNDDGTVIVRLDEYGIETPILLQKSNGAALYATTDMATIKYRWERWQPAKVLYFVDGAQQFHFKQVFALADKLGYGQPEYTHIWFGTLDQINEDGTRSKMSSRKGVILLEELLDKAEARARGVVNESGSADVSEEDIKKIAVGAVKFADFMADRRTGILFDWDHMFSTQGFSAPYIQYAGVRVRSILEKFEAVEELPLDATPYNWQAEKDILTHLHTYPQVIHEAAALYEPHKVAQFVYELARILNRYYEETSIAHSESALQQKRLWLLGQVQAIHAHALSLLGIEVPTKM